VTGLGIAQIALYCVALMLLAYPLGLYMARVFERTAVGRIERVIYRLAGVDAQAEMTWRRYAVALMMFTVLGLVVVYLMLRLQHGLPWNPNGLGNVTPQVAFNTAISFHSNTNWQTYGGETTMSHLVQMIALTTQNFVSAAVGLAVLVALIRGFVRKHSETIGNFWVDLTRSTLYILLPVALVLAALLVWQGVPQTAAGTVSVDLVESATAQDVAVGPVASQISIKQLGTNGGGYYNTNSAHPLENPTPLSNFLEDLAILLFPAACCFMFGRMVQRTGQGRAFLIAMWVLFLPWVIFTAAVEQAGNPLLDEQHVDQVASVDQAGGNMEGKEVRFGISASALWATSTTAASNGSVNSMHDSYLPLSGLAPMFLMGLGEVAFGGIGSGLYGMILFAIVAVFISGLMVGRTPELMGKKVEAFEMKMASVGILAPAMICLLAAAIAVMTSEVKTAVPNPGAHGFSEVLYAFISQANNNGSAFGGLTASGTWFATLGAICMFIGRYWIIVATLAMAGSLAKKKLVPTSAGTLPTEGGLFITLLVGVVLLVGVLTLIPAFALGPIAEHLELP